MVFISVLFQLCLAHDNVHIREVQWCFEMCTLCNDQIGRLVFLSAQTGLSLCPEHSAPSWVLGGMANCEPRILLRWPYLPPAAPPHAQLLAATILLGFC
jgi:hypothetical protein